MWSIFLLRFIIASTYLIAKASFAVVQPLFFVGTFSGIAGLLLLLWCRQTGSFQSITKSDMWLLGQVALSQIYLPYTIDFHAAQHVSSNVWALIHAACPFVTALFSWIVFKEVLNKKKYLGLAVGMLGFATIFIWDSESSLHSTSLVAESALMISMIIYAYSWIVTKKLTDTHHPLFINGIVMTAGGALALMSSGLYESWTDGPVMHMQSYIGLLALGIVTIIGSFPLYAFLLKRYSATFLAFSSLLEPIFVALFAWIVFAESISCHFICALLLLSSGLYIFYREELHAQAICVKES